MNKQEKYYDAEKKKALNNRYIFRVIAIAYLIYLVYSLIKTTASGESEMELWLQILLIALLGAATLAIAIFSIIRYKKELAAAEITKEEYYAHIDAIETEASVEDAVSDSSDENLGIPEDVEIMDESEDTDVDESESVEDDED